MCLIPCQPFEFTIDKRLAHETRQQNPWDLLHDVCDLISIHLGRKELEEGLHSLLSRDDIGDVEVLEM